MNGIDLEIRCSWCGILMRPGATLDGLVSHSCCCLCRAKYFPTLADASDHQWEIIGRDHEDCTDGNSPRMVSCHLDKQRCTRCEMVEELDPYTCNCEKDD